MTPQLNSEIEAVLRALKEGRSLSEKSKWPWHVSIIEGDFLPAYGSDVFNLFKQKSETSLGSASYPCSARLWKALYGTLRGLYLAGAGFSDIKWICQRFLQELRRIKAGDIFNYQGRNLSLDSSSAQKAINEHKEHGHEISVRLGQRWNAILYAWTEACAQGEHTNLQERHGAYSLPDGSVWYINTFHQLNSTLASWRSGICVPFEVAELAVEWRGPEQHIEVFNNCLNCARADFGKPIRAYLTFAKTGIDPNSALDSVLRRTTEMATWVESLAFDGQLSLVLDGWWRRLEPVFGFVEGPVDRRVVAGLPGCSFSELESFLSEGCANDYQ
jgi:hypothetical protein